MEILCIKHIGFEGPAAISQWSQQRGHNLHIAPIYQEHHLPSPENYDALIVMGGPMNAYEDDKYPWLPKEKSYIRNAIAAGKHVLGVCLGAQLIAHALGAHINAGEQVEIGWFPITRDADCPEHVPLDATVQAFHWHGDTFTMPKGAHLIAQSEACAHQGFIYRDRVLALQCHLEMTRESLALLTAACSNELTEGPYIQTAERMQNEPDETYTQMHATLFALLDDWAKH